MRILYAEDPLSLLLVSTFFNSFELLYIKSKTPGLSAKAGLSNESFPKVEKLLGRDVEMFYCCIDFKWCD